MAAHPNYPAYHTLTRAELVDQRNMFLDAAEQVLADVRGDGAFASEAMVAQGNLAAGIAQVYNGIIAELDRIDNPDRELRVQRDFGVHGYGCDH